MEIYVGNLSYDTTDSSLSEAFGRFGQISRATVVKDRVTGRSRGFGFVEMTDSGQARAAIESLNGSELDGRVIVVNEARPKSQAPRTQSGRGGYGGGGGGGRY